MTVSALRVTLPTWVLSAVLAVSCSEADEGGEAGAGDVGRRDGSTGDSAQRYAQGELSALSYNVAGLPEGMSASNPSVNMPLISPLLNDFNLVLVQEDWLTPDPNPFEGILDLDVYHDLLAADARHDFRSEPAPLPLGADPRRLEALISDGLNRFSDYPFGPVTRVAWEGCFGGADTSDGGAADCLALKGFSVATHTLDDGVEVEVYNLHAEAGRTEEDQRLSQANFEQLAAFIVQESSGRAILLGGDTNLRTTVNDPEGMAAADNGAADNGIWETFKQATGLTDVCDVIAPCEESIDKFAFRSSDSVVIEPLSHTFERERFQREDGQPLSDHSPLAVVFRFTQK